MSDYEEAQPSEEEETTAPSDLSPEATEQEDSPASTQVEEIDSDADWDTDLEADDTDQRTRRVTPTELYLQACQLCGAVPASFYLRRLGNSTLNLNHHGLGPLGAKALAIALVSDLDVIHLELEDNFLQAEGTHYLMEMLNENFTIQSVNLSNNHLQSKGVKCITKLLAENVSIKSLKMSGNGFVDEDARTFAEAFANNYRVKELVLSHNQLCEKGGHYLGQMLGNNEGIETLDLSWNHLRMSGAVALCAGLKVNVTLKQLDLSYNGFGNVGAQALGEALHHNNTLVLLDVSSNRISDEGTRVLFQGLAANDSLRVLRMASNPITKVGALALLTSMKNNPKSALEEVNISTVLVNEQFVELLDTILQDHSTLVVQYQGVSGSITRNKKPSDALKIFQGYLDERKESCMDFFQTLDNEGTMQVSNSDFRKAAQQAGILLDKHQLEWLIQNFDMECTGKINYSQFAEQPS
ncbi:leucine-rich repeat-containing protein 74A-like [Osmerus mordax]|uniref:leucine-rich repeat-containing protein 74A-like n=1 Tax=Osmerus mordax TaxID=8014 RepID=UPI00350FECF4